MRGSDSNTKPSYNGGSTKIIIKTLESTYKNIYIEDLVSVTNKLSGEKGKALLGLVNEFD